MKVIEDMMMPTKKVSKYMLSKTKSCKNSGQLLTSIKSSVKKTFSKEKMDKLS